MNRQMESNQSVSLAGCGGIFAVIALAMLFTGNPWLFGLFSVLSVFGAIGGFMQPAGEGRHARDAYRAGCRFTAVGLLVLTGAWIVILWALFGPGQ